MSIDMIQDRTPPPTTKPIYSLSASLINALKWYESKPSDDSYNALVQKLTQSYVGNQYTDRGNRFEDEVMAKEHSFFNPYLTDTYAQKWYSKIIDFGDFAIRLSGKVDLIKKDETHIYDIKRVGYHYKGKYDRDKTIQHDLYMFLCDKAQAFTYLIAADGQYNKGLEYITETYERTPDLEAVIKQEVQYFLEFLYKHNLIPVYMENFEFVTKS